MKASTHNRLQKCCQKVESEDIVGLTASLSCVAVWNGWHSTMDSIDTLLAIQLPLSDSESSSSTSSSSSNNETDAEDNINNEDDQVDVGSDDDDDDGSEVIYADVMNSAGSTPRYGAIADTIGAAAPQSSTQQRPLALTYSTTQSSAAAPPSSSAATTSRFVPAASSAATAAAAAAKGPPTPVIVTASPMAVLGPVSLRPPQTEYEPAASVAATRLSAQYTDSLRRRAETLIQKRLRMQVKRWLQLPFDCSSTAIQSPFDSHSSANRPRYRPFDDTACLFWAAAFPLK